MPSSGPLHSDAPPASSDKALLVGSPAVDFLSLDVVTATVPRRRDPLGWCLSLMLHGFFALTLTGIATVPVREFDPAVVLGANADGGSGGVGGSAELASSGTLNQRKLTTELPPASSGWQHFRASPQELNTVFAHAVSTLAFGRSTAGNYALSSGQGNSTGDGSGEAGTGNGSGPDGSGVGFFGTNTVARTCVYVVDMSGSMHGRRFRRALSELNRSITALQTTQQFYVILFSDYAVPLFNENSLGRSPGSSPLAAIPATLTNKNRAHAWLKSMTADGETYPAEALKMALEIRPDVIYFLTDGEIPADVPATIGVFNRRRVVIHTIGFENTAGEGLLKRLAAENRGTYRYVR